MARAVKLQACPENTSTPSDNYNGILLPFKNHPKSRDRLQTKETTMQGVCLSIPSPLLKAPKTKGRNFSTHLAQPNPRGLATLFSQTRGWEAERKRNHVLA